MKRGVNFEKERDATDGQAFKADNKIPCNKNKFTGVPLERDVVQFTLNCLKCY